MRTWLVTAVLLSPLACGQVLAQSAEEVELRISELIDKLGAPKYVERQAAQQRLREEGLAAFDQLLEATNDADPEIAASSQRLLQTMTIRWTRPGDPPSVRRLLDSYGGFDEQDRRGVVVKLAALGDEGVPALCRIARFDVSGRVSREAALSLIQTVDYELPAERLEAIAAAEQELTSAFGVSHRPAARWVRLFALQSQAEAPLDAWRHALALEQHAVEERGPETNERLLALLRWNWLRVQLGARRQEELVDTVNALTTAGPQQVEATLTRALEWMIEAGADDGIDRVLEDRRDDLLTKRGRYLAAIIRDRQGRKDLAAQLADEAFETPPPPEDDQVLDGQKLIDGRVKSGDRLQDRGYAEWARREYRAAAESTPALSVNAVWARGLLANSLFDHERYAEAAAEIALVTDAVAEDIKTQARYESLADDFDFLPSYAELQARNSFYQAMAAHKQGNSAKEVPLLRDAIEKDGSDADLLIALFRVAQQTGDEALEQEASQHVSRLAADLQDQIDSNPDDPRSYNHWAWLVSNTEGDFAKAVRYSRHSLKLRPGDAGYLDTLGRCYYALGDLEQAVRQQREAVRREPHMMVLKRQLELFESELAAQQ